MNVRNFFNRALATVWLATLLTACAQQGSVPFSVLEFSALGVNIFLPGSSVREKLTFDGSISQVLEKDGQTLCISGFGSIRYGNNRIEVLSRSVTVNSREIRSEDRRIQNFVLQEDGDLHPGFIRTFR